MTFYQTRENSNKHIHTNFSQLLEGIVAKPSSVISTSVSVNRTYIASSLSEPITSYLPVTIRRRCHQIRMIIIIYFLYAMSTPK